MSVSRLALAVALSTACAASADADVLIRVDQSTQHMSVDVDGEHLYDWRVSTGRPGYDTPDGQFQPNRMDADHVSKEYDNAPMPHAIFFDLHGHAIHGSYDPIGHPAASHGCVRLSPANAATLFSLVKAEGMAHTHVQIGGDVTVALANAKSTRKLASLHRRWHSRNAPEAEEVEAQTLGRALPAEAEPDPGATPFVYGSSPHPSYFQGSYDQTYSYRAPHSDWSW